ncbi:hypothetical protein DUI87_01090 [Hirundo rustica rustica]|uniref:Uncharacterized protein n=1 Tax=Hirundo rustica rustica TaxID=333673 RepID=A0A3M0L8H6_HIRRU|nr:hypothetical protein DUI87_01090 [Hirundo rustica rustica]
MEQITLGVITRHVENNQGIKPSQHGFIKVRSFYEQVPLQNRYEALELKGQADDSGDEGPSGESSSSAVKQMDQNYSLIYLLIVSVLLISPTLGDMGIYMADLHK